MLKVTITIFLGSLILGLCEQICEFQPAYDSELYTYANYNSTVRELKAYLEKNYKKYVDPSKKWNDRSPWNFFFGVLAKRVKAFHDSSLGDYSVSRRGLELSTYYKLEEVMLRLKQWRDETDGRLEEHQVTKSSTKAFLNWLGGNML